MNTPQQERGRGRFFVLDGIDGCGKSTQAHRLLEALSQSAEAAGRMGPLHLREPGSTALGERLRELLLDGEAEIGPPSEVLLFASARRQLLTELVAPALAEGRDVVCERFHPATLSYQAHAGALDFDEVLALLTTWAGDPTPDLCVVIEVDPDRAASRRGGDDDRIEARGLEYQRNVAEGFRRCVDEISWVVSVDGEGSVDEVAARVMQEVERGA
ncbi:MAG: dTMP kinase [Planctomycetes bacterium]|nr:dTMP kinase [Planctomycetota bacterium]